MVNLNFYKGKIILVTGHTGFKGVWLCKILINAGAKIIGYSLRPTNNFFEISGIKKNVISIFGDIRDFKKLLSVFKKYKPTCVFHLAAQPLVIDSYKFPKETYEINVIGTVNVLECIRQTNTAKSFLNVTTDKVYLNNDIKNYAFKEDDLLDGYDPYSNSKSCSELVTHSYFKSFFNDINSCSISTARAGNVIGGGDFSKDRIIPDCVRAALNHKKIIIRNPDSIRPYQYVLEPLFVYLEIVEKQFNNIKFSGYYNIGPDINNCVSTKKIVQLFCKYWGNVSWISIKNNSYHEANFLKLNNTKIKKIFRWEPCFDIEMSIKKTVDWWKIYEKTPLQIKKTMDCQISEYLNLFV